MSGDESTQSLVAAVQRTLPSLVLRQTMEFALVPMTRLSVRSAGVETRLAPPVRLALLV